LAINHGNDVFVLWPLRVRITYARDYQAQKELEITLFIFSRTT